MLTLLTNTPQNKEFRIQPGKIHPETVRECRRCGHRDKRKHFETDHYCSVNCKHRVEQARRTMYGGAAQ